MWNDFVVMEIESIFTSHDNTPDKTEENVTIMI